MSDIAVSSSGHGRATRVAVASLAVAVAVAATKLTVGVLSGSIGVLSDAFHSVLDAGATGLTLFAVRLARKPPDREHPYGHGRVENLVAFGQACLLVVVSAVVAVEAVRRLVAGSALDPPIYALALMGGAVVVDAWRSVALSRAAERYDSQALAADALNFRSDVLGSLAVLGGLVAARLGFPAGDPIAALIVVAIIWWLAVRIGAQSVNMLMDRRPEGLGDHLARAAMGVEGVVGVQDVRVRRAGPHAHAEISVHVGRTTPVERSHDIAESVRAAVQDAVPGTSAVVAVHPSAEGEDVVSRVFAAANRIGLADQVHNVLAIRHPEGLWLMLHAKVPASTPLGRAHEVSDVLEEELRREVDGLARVEIHLEPRESQHLSGKVVSAQFAELAAEVREITERFAPITRCHEVAVSETPDGQHLVLHCEAPPDVDIGRAHEASRRVEDEIHRRWDRVRTVTIHFEPSDEAS